MVESDSSECLYESSEFSVIQTLAILFTWFCSFPISKEAFGRLLYLLHQFVLPVNNKLPNSYERARSTIQDFLVPVQEYDCCVNDCIVFRNCSDGKFKDLIACPKCDSDRYYPSTKIAKKRFKYIPLAPRIKRMFANETVSELLQRHQGQQQADVINVSELHQSQAWRSMYAFNGPFKGDPRGISLSFCTDGTNPFSKEKVSYSMWPLTLAILNFPLHIRNHSGSMLMAGIIPGKTEPNNLDPYVQI